MEGLLITSVDAALAGQNALLAAESLGYGGVIIGLVRYKSVELAELFKLPDYHRVASYRDFIDDFEKSAGERDLLFVTGSLYFISEVRAYLIKI